VAFDKAGNNKTARELVVVDNTPPSAKMLGPPCKAFLKGISNVTLSVYDANLKRLRLLINGTFVKEWKENGAHTYEWDTTSWPDGAYTLELVAYDKVYNHALENLTVLVDNTKPNVSILNPVEGFTLVGKCEVNFAVEDKNLVSVSLRIDNVAINVTGREAYEWNTAEVGDGAHVIKIVALDEAGNVGEAQVTVNTINAQRAAEKRFFEGLTFGAAVGSAVAGAFFLLLWRRASRK